MTGPTRQKRDFLRITDLSREELAELLDLVRTNRLVTLTGVGGVGKTRLTCSSVSTKMMITGSLPPASTRCEVSTRCRPRNPAAACRAVAAYTFSFRR